MDREICRQLQSVILHTTVKFFSACIARRLSVPPYLNLFCHPCLPLLFKQKRLQYRNSWNKVNIANIHTRGPRSLSSLKARRDHDPALNIQASCLLCPLIEKVPLRLWLLWIYTFYIGVICWCRCRMVKFVLKKVVEGCRSGELIVNDKTLQTPMCMLYTRAGSTSFYFWVRQVVAPAQRWGHITLAHCTTPV